LRIIFSLLFLVLLMNSCTETSTKPQLESAEVIFEPDSSDSNRIFIRDRTGKEWDVTHAVNKYGFDPKRFQFGLGPFAIQPILEPKFLSPEDPDFGSVNGDVIVIGAKLNGMARAYPLYILGSHEIVDEQFGPTHVAVGY
jgi:hypothetical protein